MTHTKRKEALDALESLLRHCDDRSLSPEDTNYGHYLAKKIRSYIESMTEPEVVTVEELGCTIESAIFEDRKLDVGTRVANLLEIRFPNGVKIVRGE